MTSSKTDDPIEIDGKLELIKAKTVVYYLLSRFRSTELEACSGLQILPVAPAVLLDLLNLSAVCTEVRHLDSI